MVAVDVAGGDVTKNAEHRLRSGRIISRTPPKNEVIDASPDVISADLYRLKAVTPLGGDCIGGSTLSEHKNGV